MTGDNRELPPGVVDIHGKDYHTVAKRIGDFRTDYPDWSITTKILSAADVIQMKCVIRDETGRIRATGHAEEKRGGTQINKTSALENCETSCVGRALAILSYQGVELASAEELANALEQQRELEGVERLKAHNAAVRENIDSIAAIKAYLLNDQYSLAYEAIWEVKQIDDGDVWNCMWIAPDGMILKRPHENAPDFVKLRVSFKVSEMVAFLQQHEREGWVNGDIKVSKGGKFYASLDTWTPTQGQAAKEGMGQARVAAQPDFPDEDVPF
jgi:hypothetical protein